MFEPMLVEGKTVRSVSAKSEYAALVLEILFNINTDPKLDGLTAEARRNGTRIQ